MEQLKDESNLKSIDPLEKDIQMIQLLAHYSFDIITLLTDDGTIKFASQSVERILGYHPQDRVGKNIFNYVHPDDVDYVSSEFRDRTRKVKTLELRFLHKKGHWVWLESIGQNFLDDPQIKGIIVNSRDITARKAAENQRNYLSAIIENTENICVIKDLDLRVIATNKSFMKAAGKKSIKEMIGKTDAEIFGVSPEDEPIKGYMADEKRAQKLPKGQKILREEKVIFPDKSEKTFLTIKFPVYNNNGQVIATANISTDITELKQAEKIIKKQNQELRQLNADKDRFVEILAHDLKNPIGSIVGFSDLILEQLKLNRIEKAQEFSEMVFASALQCSEFLDKLLEWVRAQTGKFNYAPESLYPRKVIDKMIKLLKSNFSNKNIEYIVDVPEKLKVFADSFMLETILKNLMSNALKFSHPHGVIKISVSEKENHSLFEVEDHGVGISKENIDKLFNIESSYSTAGTNNEKGTGLGLLICREFVERQGGEIWVESEQGRGTKFSFTIKNKK